MIKRIVFVILWTTICKSFSLTYNNKMIKVINPHNILQVPSSLTSNNLFCSSTSPITAEEKNIASNLTKCFKFILESTYHVFEKESALDHDDEIDNQDLKDLSTSTSDDNETKLADYRNYEPIGPYKLRNHFSLDYMNGVIEFFDGINPSIGKRKRKWSTVKRCFLRVSDPQCIAYFRKYIEAGRTQQRKIEMIDNYVYDRFEHARYEYLSVHDIDLRRWSFQKAHELILHDFQTSNGWLSKFKHRHGICNSRVMKLVTKGMVESPEKINLLTISFHCRMKLSKNIIQMKY